VECRALFADARKQMLRLRRADGEEAGNHAMSTAVAARFHDDFPAVVDCESRECGVDRRNFVTSVHHESEVSEEIGRAEARVPNHEHIRLKIEGNSPPSPVPYDDSNREVGYAPKCAVGGALCWARARFTVHGARLCLLQNCTRTANCTCLSFNVYEDAALIWPTVES
jgi:hypothetical protein